MEREARPAESQHPYKGELNLFGNLRWDNDREKVAHSTRHPGEDTGHTGRLLSPRARDAAESQGNIMTFMEFFQRHGAGYGACL